MSDSEQIEQVAASVVGKIKSKGRIATGGKRLEKVSRDGEPYNLYELTEFLRHGPELIQDRIVKLKRRLADPQFEHKHAMYAMKLSQLEDLIDGKITTAPTPAT